MEKEKAERDFNNVLNFGGMEEIEDKYFYLDKAYEAETEEEAKRYAKKALKLDGRCIEAELLLLDLADYTPEEYMKRLQKIIDKEKDCLVEEGFFAEECIGQFYGIFETRPYMRALNELFMLYQTVGKYRKALAIGEELLRLNKNDNLGVRYSMITIFALLEERQKCEDLYKEYEEDTVAMLLPLVALYYKVEDETNSKRYIKKLYKANNNIKRFLEEELSEEELEEYNPERGIRMGNLEEVLEALEYGSSLYLSSPGFFPWLKIKLRKILK